MRARPVRYWVSQKQLMILSTVLIIMQVQEVTFDLQGKAILGVQITEYLAPGAHGDTTRRYVFLLCKIPDGVALGPFEVTSGPSDDLESRK